MRWSALEYVGAGALYRCHQGGPDDGGAYDDAPVTALTPLPDGEVLMTTGMVKAVSCRGGALSSADGPEVSVEGATVTRVCFAMATKRTE